LKSYGYIVIEIWVCKVKKIENLNKWFEDKLDN